jgi:mannitol/fructose-specific phosphotransferase system IIA component (Ntr-type)/galactitol-specific phosphotransferase system IIB component
MTEPPAQPSAETQQVALSDRLVVLRMEAFSVEEVIRQLAARLEADGLVSSSFTEAVLERERTYPTGLRLAGDLHVAIPHADVTHVIAPALAIATLARPVDFRNMVNPGEAVPVSIVILMALNQPHAQIEMLQRLAAFFQEPQRVRRVYEAKTAEDLIRALDLLSYNKEVTMAQPKRVLVSCGTAIATSTVVAKAIEEGLAARGISVITRQCKAAEVPALAKDFDLVVTTTPVPADLGVPVIETLAFLTGIGKDETLDKIAEILRRSG